MPRPRRNLIKADSENAIQAAFFHWCSLQEAKYPVLKLFHAIPNGSHKSPASRYLHKLTGLKSGVPDTFLPAARCGYFGLYIEFKSQTGRLSETQKEWANMLAQEGFLVVTCRDAEVAAELTLQYIKGQWKAKE